MEVAVADKEEYVWTGECFFCMRFSNLANDCKYLDLRLGDCCCAEVGECADSRWICRAGSDDVVLLL